MPPDPESLPPPPPGLVAAPAGCGLVRLTPADFAVTAGLERDRWRMFEPAWASLPPDEDLRDGVDFVAVILVGRQDVRSAGTRVFPVDGHGAARFTMTGPWSALLLDDTRAIHETTPTQPGGPAGGRDTLLLTCRAAGFQAPE